MLPSWLMPESIAPTRSTSTIGLGVVSAMELTELASRRGGAVLGRCRVEPTPCSHGSSGDDHGGVVPNSGGGGVLFTRNPFLFFTALLFLGPRCVVMQWFCHLAAALRN